VRGYTSERRQRCYVALVIEPINPALLRNLLLLERDRLFPPRSEERHDADRMEATC
jgi:hypothetical protein